MMWVHSAFSAEGILVILRRTLSGVFTIDEAVSLDADLETMR